MTRIDDKETDAILKATFAERKERHSWLYNLSAIILVLSIIVVLGCCIITIWVSSKVIVITGAIAALTVPVSYMIWKVTSIAEKQARTKAKMDAYDAWNNKGIYQPIVDKTTNPPK